MPAYISKMYSQCIIFTYVRWPEDGLKKDRNKLHSRIPLSYTVMLRLTKIIRSGITFVSPNIRSPKRGFPYVSIENRLIRSGCCPLFKVKFYKIVKSTL